MYRKSSPNYTVQKLGGYNYTIIEFDIYIIDNLTAQFNTPDISVAEKIDQQQLVYPELLNNFFVT